MCDGERVFVLEEGKTCWDKTHKDDTDPLTDIVDILGDPEVTANIYSKSPNLPNTDTQNYSTDLW